jgi:multiple sugar transport system permease protein
MAVAAPAAEAGSKGPRNKKVKEWKSPDEGQGRLAAIMLSPTMLVLLLVIGLPILVAIRQSFYASGGVDESGFVQEGDNFVGLDNYTNIFSGASADRFWNAFYVTTMFTVVCVVIEVIIGVAMALIMNRAFKGRSLIRASILIPWAIPTVVSAVLWGWIFNANGVANDLLGTQILWSTDGIQAQLAVIIADTWKTAPFIGLLVLAGLQVIPEEVYEAAKIDGSSTWNSFVHITLPLVKPALLVAVLFRILDNLRMFDLPFVLVGKGKPSVETLSILAYLESTNTRFGPASAYAILLFLYIVLVAFAFVKLLGADVIGDARKPKSKTPKGGGGKAAGGRRSKVGRTVAKGDTP